MTDSVLTNDPAGDPTGPPASSSDSPAMNIPVKYWLAVAALAVMCAVVYWPAMHGAAIWDDGYSLVDNHNLRDMQGLADTVISPLSLPVYYPGTFVSFWIEHRIFGLDPTDLFGYHATNLILQILNAWMLWEILRRLKVPGAWLIAAIWAIHPVQVESVAWVSERKNTLSAFFFFLSILIWMRFTNLDPIPPPPKEGEEEPLFALPRDRVRLYILSVIFFALALLSKSAVLTLPPTLLLILWWKRGRITRQDWLESVAYFVLAIVMGATTMYIEKYHTGASGTDWEMTFGQSLSIAGRTIWFYPAKLFWPQSLSFVYHRWPVSGSLGAIGALAAIGVIAVLWALRDRIGRAPLAAVLFFAGTLFPILGFFPFVFQRYSFVADHFQYLACIGLIALVVAGLRKAIKLDGAFAVVGAAILIALGSISWRQSHLYQNAESIWTDVIAKDPDSWMAHNNLGTILLERGDPASLDQAEAHFNRSIQLKPEVVDAHTNLALVYDKRGDIPKAIELLKIAQQVSQSNSFHSADDANVYYHLGRMYLAQKNPRAALVAFRTAVDLYPHHVPAASAMGALLLEYGDYDHAALWIDRALKLDPDYLPAHTNLGNLYAAKGNPVAALGEWNYVLQRDRNNVVAIDSVGRLMAGMGNWDQAIFQFNKALAIDPKFALAKTHLEAAGRHKRDAATQATTRSTTRAAAGSSTQAIISGTPIVPPAILPPATQP